MNQITASAEEEMNNKEKLLDKQKRLADQKEFLKDKFRHVSEKNSGCGEDKKDEPSSRYQKIPTPTVSPRTRGNITYNNNVSRSVLKSPRQKHELFSNTPTHEAMGSSSIVRDDICDHKSELQKEDQFSNNCVRGSQDKSKFKLPTDHSRKISLKSNMNLKDSKLKPKQENRNKVLKKKSKSSNDSKFFSPIVADKYFKNTSNEPFQLPHDEYQELMKIKSSLETSRSLLADTEFVEKDKQKCFYQMKPLIDSKEDDSPILDCHIDGNILILVHRDSFNAYERKEKKSKEWILKNSNKRLRFSNIVKEFFLSCQINGKETLLYCQIYITSDESKRTSVIKMAQNFLLEQSCNSIKEYRLGSFDCALENLQCCHIAKRTCCIAITGWNVARARTVGWVFTYSQSDNVMRCGTMIPLKHRVESLHDISLMHHKNILLAFGDNVFTIWNAKTGERLSHCSLESISPMGNITCHFGCFATVQKGYLFVMVSTGDKLHMVATDLDTEISKSLRTFKLPRNEKSVTTVYVRDDKLVAITDSSIICWNLKNTQRISRLSLDQGDKPFLTKGKILITSCNRLKKILTVKPNKDYKREMAEKMNELMNYESGDNTRNG